MITNINYFIFDDDYTCKISEVFVVQKNGEITEGKLIQYIKLNTNTKALYRLKWHPKDKTELKHTDAFGFFSGKEIEAEDIVELDFKDDFLTKVRVL